MISRIVKKLQPFFEIQDGGDRHLVFSQICMFQIEVSMFPQILVTIGQILKKWQQFFKIQLAKYTSG